MATGVEKGIGVRRALVFTDDESITERTADLDVYHSPVTRHSSTRKPTFWEEFMLCAHAALT